MGRTEFLTPTIKKRSVPAGQSRRTFLVTAESAAHSSKIFPAPASNLKFGAFPSYGMLGFVELGRTLAAQLPHDVICEAVESIAESSGSIRDTRLSRA